MNRITWEFVLMNLMLIALSFLVVGIQAQEQEYEYGNQEGPTGAVMNVQTVRVRMPDGRKLEVTDSPDNRWWRSPELEGYNRFYFVPTEGSYRVFDNPRRWPHPRRWDSTNPHYNNGEPGPVSLMWRPSPSPNCPVGMPSYGIGTMCQPE